MIKRNVIAGSICALLLVACGGDEAAAKKAVLGHLKDPDSAKFGKFSLAGTKGACLTVNAKNSMGGYTGDQQAFLLKDSEKGWIVIAIDKDLDHKMCIEVLSKP